MAQLLDGKKVRDELALTMRQEVISLGVKPVLVIFEIGTDGRKRAYIEQKKKFAASIGADVIVEQFADDSSEQQILERLIAHNDDLNVHGILIQLPVAKTINGERLIGAINPAKDVDGLTAVNLKKILTGQKDGFIPATAMAVCKLLDYYNISVSGKKVVVIGRSFLVGKPTALELLNRDATVTICHSKTLNLENLTKNADVIVVAAGSPTLIGAGHVNTQSVVIDVGINVVSGLSGAKSTKLNEEIEEKEKRLVGDVDFEAVFPLVSAISPVPGGVGPLTVVSLFENLLKACRNQAILGLGIIK